MSCGLRLWRVVLVDRVHRVWQAVLVSCGLRLWRVVLVDRVHRVWRVVLVNRAFRLLFPAALGALLGVASPMSVLAATESPDIAVKTRVSADSVTVGERLRVSYEISFPDSMRLVPPQAFETGTCRLLSVTWKDAGQRSRVTETAELEIMTTDLEEARLPEMTFLFVTPRGDSLTARSEEVEVGVRRLAQAEAKPKPLKPQWEAPRSYAFLIVIAAALAVAALAVWLVRRWRKRKVVKPVEPELPADFVALRKLEEIERMGLLDSGEMKKYYTLVIDVLRGYLEKRYGFLAMDQTTDEILWGLRRLQVDAADIEPLLREADLVKFAKHRPEAAGARGLIDAVRVVVARTAPRPLVAAETA